MIEIEAENRFQINKTLNAEIRRSQCENARMIEIEAIIPFSNSNTHYADLSAGKAGLPNGKAGIWRSQCLYVRNHEALLTFNFQL